jgi:putative peptidoglycan lipid II flippase
MNRESVARAALGMGGATAVSRLFGFVRVLLVAAVLGTTYLGNTFQATNSVSNVLFELLAAGALSAVLVPTFVRLIEGGDDAGAQRLASGLLGAALVFLVPIVVVGMVASPWLAKLLSTGAPNAAVQHEQEKLASFLLVFFIPQVLFYAFGAVATALLYARRRFVVTAAAPIGNTIVMVASLIAFRIVAGANPGFDLSNGEKLLLAWAGTGGVLAFVAVLVIAAHRAGFSVRPRWHRRDPELRTLVRHSTWGILLQAEVGMLLGAAIIVGNGVAGGVVAYQVAFVFFLAPYAVLAQPIHTAVLPELSNEAAANDRTAFAHSIEWSLDRMAVLTLPVAAAMVALALPFMHVVAFGGAEHSGPELLAAGLATLALGLFPYAAVLLFARAFYALGDSKTPAVVALATGFVGVITMVVLAPLTHGAARVGAIGIGHTTAYTLGAVALAVMLRRRLGHAFVPRRVPVAIGCAVPLGVVAWVVVRVIDPQSRAATIAVLLVLGLAGLAGYVFAIRKWLPARPAVVDA